MKNINTRKFLQQTDSLTSTQYQLEFEGLAEHGFYLKVQILLFYKKQSEGSIAQADHWDL